LPLALDLLSPDEGRDLLARRAGSDRVDAEPAAVDKIIERCARLPLALAIVATRAATQPALRLAALAADLRHLHERLDTLATGDPSTDVRSVFSWSYQQLSASAARLFRLLGAHPGPDLSASAAASLVGTSVGRVRPVLAELVSGHLVSERAPGRYVLHDLLRVYAAELVTSDEPQADRQEAVRRLTDHYLSCTHRADAALQPNRDGIELVEPLAGVTVDEFTSAAEATDWLTAEYPVLLGAVRLAVDAGLDRHAWQLVWSMATYLERHQGFRDAVALQRIALRAAQRMGDLPAQAYSHRLLGRAQAMLGDHDEAHAHLERAFTAYQQLGDDSNQAFVRLGLAAMLDRQGRYRDALHQAEQALTRFRTSGHRIGQASALNNIGWFHIRLGDYETSLKYCEEALRLQQELGNRRGEAFTRDSLGAVYHHLGRHAEAIAAYQQALTLLRDHGNRYYEAETLVHLGDAHDAAGDVRAARDCWRPALAILADFAHPDAEHVLDRLRTHPAVPRR
jgi:tetratricopeptide (TPR) repeat protein